MIFAWNVGLNIMIEMNKMDDNYYEGSYYSVVCALRAILLSAADWHDEVPCSCSGTNKCGPMLNIEQAAKVLAAANRRIESSLGSLW
jgi:hypothetical protein